MAEFDGLRDPHPFQRTAQFVYQHYPLKREDQASGNALERRLSTLRLDGRPNAMPWVDFMDADSELLARRCDSLSAYL